MAIVNANVVTSGDGASREERAATRALVFPGQGSQAVGMGKALAEQFATAKAVLDEVDDALGDHLSRLMADGPIEELTLTKNAQPALMAVSMAVVRVMERDYGIDLKNVCRVVAGHSLGEYTALTAAGTFTIADAARLLRTRGLAMQSAVPVGEGAMAALIGVDIELAQEIAAEATLDCGGSSVCVAANDNAPGQVVISGTRRAVERAVALAALRGGKRSMMLPVSAPFHCPLMAPAADVMAAALQAVPMNQPRVPVIANVTAREIADVSEIPGNLVRQVTGMVRWRESVTYMSAQRITEVVEIGSGNVLCGLAKRIDRGISGSSVGTPGDVEALVQRL